jgi:hypothetical protein
LIAQTESNSFLDEQGLRSFVKKSCEAGETPALAVFPRKGAMERGRPARNASRRLAYRRVFHHRAGDVFAMVVHALAS